VIANLYPGNNAILKLSDIEARGVSVGLEISGGTQEDAAARYAIYECYGKAMSASHSNWQNCGLPLSAASRHATNHPGRKISLA
jgi:hypothetical protein